VALIAITGDTSEYLILVLDPATLSARETLSVAGAIAGRDTPTQLVATGDSTVLIRTLAGLTSCVAARITAICRSVTVPSSAGGLWFRAGDRFALINDAGTRDTPGSGMLFRISLAADSVESIPLPLTNGAPTATTSVLVDRAKGLWYVVAGSPPLGPTYPPQPQRVLIFDPTSRRVLRELPSVRQLRGVYPLQ
jgi:hypothetical protein